jgi:hypothetical protein
MRYRITGSSGTFTTTFAGRVDPLCVPLDACGASGIITDAISSASSQLDIDAQRVVKRRVSRRNALADLRSGRLPLFDTGVLLKDVLSASFRWPDGSACTDRLRQLNALSLNATSARRTNLVFSLDTDATEDPFRSVCPGPAAGEVLGPSSGDVLGPSSTLAQASLPLTELGRRTLRIAVSGHGRFVAGSYAGTDSGGLTVGLRLVRVRAGTKVEDVFPGES